MTDYFVSSGGDNSDGLTWAKSFTSLASAVTAASTAGDRIIIQYNGVPSGDTELAADITYTAAADNVVILSSTNSGTATVTPTAMGTSNWIGHSTSNRGIIFNPAASGKLYLWGLTLRMAGTGGDYFTFSFSNNGHVTAENCYLWPGSSSSSAGIRLGTDSSSGESSTTLKGCTIRFGGTGGAIWTSNGHHRLDDCTVSSAGSAPTILFRQVNMVGGSPIIADGCDFSYVDTTLLSNSTLGPRSLTCRNCKLPASYVAMDSQTAPVVAGGEVWLFDCHSGDEHIHIGHYNGLGQTTVDTGIYANDNIADSNLSWKIIGTTQATAEIPYRSPWIEVYHTGTSAITPYLECVRSGSATAYNDNVLWSEFAYKGTSGSTKVTFVNDGMALAGSAAAQANSSKSASDWTGENATSWFGKIDSGSSITPAEVGHIRARVCVAGANTIYVDPQIRGLS